MPQDSTPSPGNGRGGEDLGNPAAPHGAIFEPRSPGREWWANILASWALIKNEANSILDLLESITDFQEEGRDEVAHATVTYALRMANGSGDDPILDESFPNKLPIPRRSLYDAIASLPKKPPFGCKLVATITCQNIAYLTQSRRISGAFSIPRCFCEEEKKPDAAPPQVSQEDIRAIIRAEMDKHKPAPRPTEPANSPDFPTPSRAAGAGDSGSSAPFAPSKDTYTENLEKRLAQLEQEQTITRRVEEELAKRAPAPTANLPAVQVPDYMRDPFTMFQKFLDVSEKRHGGNAESTIQDIKGWIKEFREAARDFGQGKQSLGIALTDTFSRLGERALDLWGGNLDKLDEADLSLLEAVRNAADRNNVRLNDFLHLHAETLFAAYAKLRDNFGDAGFAKFISLAVKLAQWFKDESMTVEEAVQAIGILQETAKKTGGLKGALGLMVAGLKARTQQRTERTTRRPTHNLEPSSLPLTQPPAQPAAPIQTAPIQPGPAAPANPPTTPLVQAIIIPQLAPVAPVRPEPMNPAPTPGAAPAEATPNQVPPTVRATTAGEPASPALPIPPTVRATGVGDPEFPALLNPPAQPALVLVEREKGKEAAAVSPAPTPAAEQTAAQPQGGQP